MSHTILMGDPSSFRITGGANPFTRNRWGMKKLADRKKAIGQWEGLVSLLRSLGVTVHIIPPDPNHPGLIYPANAGVRLGDVFVLSNLTPSRTGERPIYERFIQNLGLKTVSIQARFEGEADLFPCGECWIFTYGHVQRQRFVFQVGLPPWKRVYGFRSERGALEELRPYLPSTAKIHSFELAYETHYHGDTVFCPFGKNREQLLCFLDGLTEESQAHCRKIFGEYLLPLRANDAFCYAANSFQVEHEGQLKLIMPRGVSETLLKKIAARGVEPLLIDVSEFLTKGGGAVKCLLGDLTVPSGSRPLITE